MLHTVSFVGTVAAGSTKVLVSKQINFPYTIRRLIANFSLGQARQNQISFFLSNDSAAPATGLPSGSNILQFLSQESYIVGDDDKKDLEHFITSEDWPTWLKIYANNTDGFEHSIDCQIIIEKINQANPEH